MPVVYEIQNKNLLFTEMISLLTIWSHANEFGFPEKLIEKQLKIHIHGKETQKMKPLFSATEAFPS